jgi:methylmalonyl-CoA carboxyltransferase 12S subunit
MDKKDLNWAQIQDALHEVRQELAQLRQRVAALESAKQPAPSPVPEPAAAPRTTPVAPAPDGVSEELVLVLGAAVAAFLGKRAPIRQIRLLGSAAWAQQGRVTIQASHAR